MNESSFVLGREGGGGLGEIGVAGAESIFILFLQFIQLILLNSSQEVLFKPNLKLGGKTL